ncbi:MAG: MFS transporter [Chloroflexota bacterium]|nr:MFS transporter [Chloroflexota bacterium]
MTKPRVRPPRPVRPPVPPRPRRRLPPRPSLHILPAVPPSAPGSLPPSVVLRGMRMSVADGVFSQLFLTLTTGSFVTALALFMGANDLLLGLISVLPVVTGLLQLPAAWLVERSGKRRAITVWASLGRLLWLVPAALLFVPISTGWRLGLAVTAMTLSLALLAISTNAWLSWMSDLIPPTLRGRFFGTRNTVLALVGLATIPAGGALLDFARGAHYTDLGFLTLYAVATVAAAVSTLFVSRQPEPPFQRAVSRGFGALLRAPWRDRPFRSFVFTMALWGMGVNVGTAFFSAQALKVLHVSYSQLATLDMTTVGVTLLTQPLWGRWADRVGHRRVLTVGLVGASPLALTWLLITPDNLWLLYLNNVLAGIFWPALNLSLGNRLMERAPAAGRAGYMAIYWAFTGVVAFVASISGGVLANALAGGQYALGPLTLNHYQVLFLLAGLIRVGTAVFRRRTL